MANREQFALLSTCLLGQRPAAGGQARARSQVNCCREQNNCSTDWPAIGALRSAFLSAAGRARPRNQPAGRQQQQPPKFVRAEAVKLKQNGGRKLTQTDGAGDKNRPPRAGAARTAAAVCRPSMAHSNTCYSSGSARAACFTDRSRAGRASCRDGGAACASLLRRLRRKFRKRKQLAARRRPETATTAATATTPTTSARPMTIIMSRLIPCMQSPAHWGGPCEWRRRCRATLACFFVRPPPAQSLA